MSDFFPRARPVYEMPNEGRATFARLTYASPSESHGAIIRRVRDLHFEEEKIYRKVYGTPIPYRAYATAAEVVCFENDKRCHPSWNQLQEGIMEHLQQTRQSADTAIVDALGFGTVARFERPDFVLTDRKTWFFCVTPDQLRKLSEVELLLAELYQLPEKT